MKLSMIRALARLPFLFALAVPTLALAQASTNKAACEARVNACMPRTACPAWVKEQPSFCWTNNCSFKNYLTWGVGTTGDPLKQGDVYASSVDSPFKGDPRSDNWRILDCEVPASAQAIAALPMPQAAPAPGAVGLAPVTVPQTVPTLPQASDSQPVSGNPSSPRGQCGGRVFLALNYCMARVCKQPEFAGHSDCALYVKRAG